MVSNNVIAPVLRKWGGGGGCVDRVGKVVL